MVKGIYFSPFKDKEDNYKFQKIWRKKFKNFEISEIRNKSCWLVDSLTKGLAMTGLQCNFETLTEENSKISYVLLTIIPIFPVLYRINTSIWYSLRCCN